MVEQLKLIVDAMINECVRQSQEERGSTPYIVDIYNGRINIDGEIDLKKIAVAGLAAITNYTEVELFLETDK